MARHVSSIPAGEVSVGFLANRQLKVDTGCANGQRQLSHSWC